MTPLLFSTDLLTLFARLSGDWNPMHMNSLAARRTQSGTQVVHGIQTVVRTLDALAQRSPDLPLPTALSVKFQKPIHLEDSAVIREVSRNENNLRLQAAVDGSVAVDLRLSLGTSRIANHAAHSFEAVSEHPCRDWSLTEMADRSGAVYPAVPPEQIAGAFPHVAAWLGVDRVAAFLCLSRLVGMECPGLHSLFSGFTLKFDFADTQNHLEYSVASVDDRFRLLKIDVRGLGIRGAVDAFARQPPTVQESIGDLCHLVARSEFAGQRALIVGGSRGLGELTAKLLAAGGGCPVITYVVGQDDAARVADEIRKWGGACEIVKYDVRSPAVQQLESLAAPVSYLYYYATSQIFRRKTKPFEPALLDEYIEFYVGGFYDLCNSLQSFPEQRISAFYPSSVAVENRPRNLTEYAMAKAAGEVLCADMKELLPGVHVTSVRLPRLQTDQTATVTPTETADSVAVILPIVRQVQAAGRIEQSVSFPTLVRDTVGGPE